MAERPVDHTLELATTLSLLKYEDLPPKVITHAKVRSSLLDWRVTFHLRICYHFVSKFCVRRTLASSSIPLRPSPSLSRRSDRRDRSILQHRQASILNALGVALGSSTHPSRVKALSALLPLSGPPTTTLLGLPRLTDPQTAALLNGIALTTTDYDDTHLSTVIHPSATPLAALLPLAQSRHSSGKEFILAFIAGVETQLAVGTALGTSHYRDGWHITSTTGTFGATSATSKLLNLPPPQLAAALGHAASMAGGVRAMFGTDTKTLHAGRGAQNGILAAMIAEQGFGSCDKAIEKWAGLVSGSVDVGRIAELALARGGGGEAGPWRILENTFKPYPCGIVVHPGIDGCLRVWRGFVDGGGGGGARCLEDIARVEVSVNPQCVRLCDVRHPRTGLEAIFSLYHGCAVALVHGRAGPAEFSDEGVKEERVVKIRGLVEAVIDDGIRDDEAWVRVWGRGRVGLEVPDR